MTFEELNKIKEEYKKKVIKWIIISAIVILGVLAFILISENTELIYLIFIVIVAMIIISSIATSKDRGRYSSAYKSYFVFNSLKSVFEDINYQPAAGISYETIAKTRMMNMGDRYSSNDLIEAKYKDIKLIQSDIHIEEEETTTDSEGNTTTTYITIFRGRWMIFDFNKTFKANFQVCEKGFGNNIVNNGLFKSKTDETYYKKVEMEDINFNKQFKVYAQSEHDAFYVLTPQLMEKIRKLADENNGKILLCFVDNKLHIGLYDGKDSFEAPSCFTNLDEQTEVNKIATDIKTITQFIDELNLDNDLFKN